MQKGLGKGPRGRDSSCRACFAAGMLPPGVTSHTATGKSQGAWGQKHSGTYEVLPGRQPGPRWEILPQSEHSCLSHCSQPEPGACGQHAEGPAQAGLLRCARERHAQQGAPAPTEMRLLEDGVSHGNEEHEGHGSERLHYSLLLPRISRYRCSVKKFYSAPKCQFRL